MYGFEARARLSVPNTAGYGRPPTLAFETRWWATRVFRNPGGEGPPFHPGGVM